MEITIKNFTKIISGTPVLENICANLYSGKVYGLQGVNGCGKTMLMRAICGLIRPTSGAIFINNQELGKEIDFPPSIGALLENPSFLYHLTGKENLQLLAQMNSATAREQVTPALERVGLNPLDKRKYRKYSLGMKQRLGIAAAVLNNPQIVVLDEPLNALDREGVLMAREVINSARSKGALVILACHNKDELLSLADELIFMENGKIVATQTNSGEGNTCTL